MAFSACTWNLHGKGLEELCHAFDQLHIFPDVLFLQEVGSLPAITSGGWLAQEFAPKGGQTYTAFVFDPDKSFRGTAVLLRQDLAAHVRSLHNLLTGASVTLKIHGVCVFLHSIHLPHLKREDALQVWQQQFAELSALHVAMRHHDISILAGDWNYNLNETCNGSEFSILSRSFLWRHGYAISRPREHTWKNHAGSNAIDYVCVRSPELSMLRDDVRWDCAQILGSDHALVDFSFVSTLGQAPRRRRAVTRCGKWCVRPEVVAVHANKLSEQLDLSCEDLSVAALADIAKASSFRPQSLRYRDPPEILELIRQRRLTDGPEARLLGKQIVELRKSCRQEWMGDVLARARNGDFAVVTFFRRRQSTMHAHTSYAISAGGVDKAVADMKTFYTAKYTCESYPFPPLQVVRAHTEQAQQFRPFTDSDVEAALEETKPGKSAGETGITYEFMRAVWQSELRTQVLDFINGVLDESIPLPPEWLQHRVTFLPKIPKPCAPKDLRPIVLSDCFGKLFTKLILYRLREIFPSNRAGQLCGSPGCQALEGAAALQQLTYQANAFHKPLVVVKLDIHAAFDSLRHDAIAKFMCDLPPCQDMYILMLLIVQANVVLGLCGREWVQRLQKGILQGSAYSAELFAKVLDWWLSQIIPAWNSAFPTHWCCNGREILHCILYADDLVLLASSWAEAERKLHELVAHLHAIGLTISVQKCAVIASAACGPGSLRFPSGAVVRQTDSFVFLGVLQGFQVTSQQVLAKRLTAAMNAFWGFYAILRASASPVRKRMALFSSFITSKWRWMAGCVRPVTATLQLANTCMMQMLVQMTGLEYDEFISPVDNWLSRRRVSKILVQVLGFPMWSGVLARMYWSFWGHVARIPDVTRCIRVTLACSFSLDLQYRRALGNWPDHHRLLQLAWQTVRSLDEPPAWFSAAQDRRLWDRAQLRWAAESPLRCQAPYLNVEEVDLCGRCLLRTHEHFTLLPRRHLPVEPSHRTSYRATPALKTGLAASNWRVCCSGASSQEVSAVAVIVAPPHFPQQRWLVRRCKLAEVRPSSQVDVAAMLEATGMCKSLIQSHAAPVLHLITDAIYAVQILYGAAKSGGDLMLHARVRSCWHAIGHAVQVSCILPSSKDPLYAQAVYHAKMACLNEHDQLETFFIDGSYGYVGQRPEIRRLPLSAFSQGSARL